MSKYLGMEVSSSSYKDMFKLLRNCSTVFLKNINIPFYIATVHERELHSPALHTPHFIMVTLQPFLRLVNISCHSLGFRKRQELEMGMFSMVSTSCLRTPNPTDGVMFWGNVNLLLFQSFCCGMCRSGSSKSIHVKELSKQNFTAWVSLREKERVHI